MQGERKIAGQKEKKIGSELADMCAAFSSHGSRPYDDTAHESQPETSVSCMKSFLFQNISIYSSYHTAKGSAVFLLSLDYCKRNRRSHSLSLSPDSPVLVENSRPTNCARCEKSFSAKKMRTFVGSVLSWRHNTQRAKRRKFLKHFSHRTHLIHTTLRTVLGEFISKNRVHTERRDISISQSRIGLGLKLRSFSLAPLVSRVFYIDCAIQYRNSPRNKFFSCNQITLIF